jgi:putative nucleotidyltransferase with HDIG domain
LVGWIRRTLAGIWGSKEPLHLSVAIENHETEPPETIDPPTVRQRPPVSAKSPVAQLMGTIKKGLTEIPPLPHVIRELLRELSDPASTARSVARIATSDPTLAAALLRTVNSAAMGLRRRINSVPEAISFLGYTAVRSLVIRMRLEQVLPTRKGQAAYDQDDLWIHSLAVAHAADCLAEQVAGKIPHVDRGFVATLGLLHDIGKLAINSYFPDSAAKVRTPDPAHMDESFLDRERRVLGADHAEIGAILAQHWKLPADLVEAIRWHHAPQDAPLSLPASVRAATTLVHLANQVSKYCYVYSEDMEIDIIPDQLFQQVGLVGPLKRLLTGRMCRAISRAIFFADASRAQPLSAVRRFVRLFDANQASVILNSPRRTEPRIKFVDDGGNALFSMDCTVISPAHRRKGKSPGTTWKKDRQVRFMGRTTDGLVEELLEAVIGHQDTLPLQEDVRLPCKFLARRLLPNLLELAKGERVDIAQSLAGDRFVLAIRSPALAFARRFEPGAGGDGARRVLEREFANVINLRWLSQIRCSPCGDTVIFVSHSNTPQSLQRAA